MTTHNHAPQTGRVTPHEWRDRVGRHLQHQRKAAGFSSRYQVEAASKMREDIAVVSESWVRQVETGTTRRNDGTVVAPNPRGNKLLAYLVLIGWPGDAIERLLNREDPSMLANHDRGEDRPPWEELIAGQREINEVLREVRDEMRRERGSA